MTSCQHRENVRALTTLKYAKEVRPPDVAHLVGGPVTEFQGVGYEKLDVSGDVLDTRAYNRFIGAFAAEAAVLAVINGERVRATYAAWSQATTPELPPTTQLNRVWVENDRTTLTMFPPPPEHANLQGVLSVGDTVIVMRRREEAFVPCEARVDNVGNGVLTLELPDKRYVLFDANGRLTVSAGPHKRLKAYILFQFKNPLPMV